jgi:hypothetical protein
MAKWFKGKPTWSTDQDFYRSNAGGGMRVQYRRQDNDWFYYGDKIRNSLWDGRSFATYEAAIAAAEEELNNTKSKENSK